MKKVSIRSLLLLSIILVLTQVSSSRKISEIIQVCQNQLSQNPDLTLQLMCIIPGVAEPQSFPHISLDSVPDKCLENQIGFYTTENYNAIKQQVKNLQVQTQQNLFEENLAFKTNGYWCDQEGKPSQSQFQQIRISIGHCTLEQKQFDCLIKIEPVRTEKTVNSQISENDNKHQEVIPEQVKNQQNQTTPGFLTTLQTIILFPFFLLFCWILPFLGTILSKNQHEKWITFWILNMVLSFLLIPLLEWFFYSPMILIIRITISLILVMFIKHSMVEKLLKYVDFSYELVKSEYNKLKQIAIQLTQNLFSK